jgi:chromosome segregation ATPase
LQHHLAEVEQRLEDRVQPIPYLEEQRRQDSRRIAETEAEVPKLHKKIDVLVDRFPLLEQAIQAKNKEIDKAADLLVQQSELIESQRVSEFRWERQIGEWAKIVDELKQETAGMTAQTIQLRDQHQLVRRALADLEPFRDRIERRQNEMSEMQRLAEDRQKRVMETWQSDREKEWERFRLQHEERWKENARFNEKRHRRLEALEEYIKLLREQIEALWEIPDAWAQAIMVGPREWLATWSELAKARPPMPEPLKSNPLAPEPKPKIRPLPSAQRAQARENAEET